jgi:hypothetical protein
MKGMPSKAKAGRAAAGTNISPVDQLLNEYRPGKKPSARRSEAASGKRMRIMKIS